MSSIFLHTHTHTQLLQRQLSQLTSSEVMDRFDHLSLYQHIAPALGPLAIYSSNVYKDIKTGKSHTCGFIYFFLKA